MGGEAALVAERGAAHRHHHPRADVVAQRHRAQQPRAVDGAGLAHRQRRRHHGRAGMRTRLVVRVVRLVRMRHHPVGQRRVGGRGREPRARDRRGALAGGGADIALRGLARGELGAGDHRGEGVEEVVLGVFGDVGGKGAGGSGGHEGGKGVHDGGGGGCLREHTCGGEGEGQCRGRGEAEKMAALHERLRVGGVVPEAMGLHSRIGCDLMHAVGGEGVMCNRGHGVSIFRLDMV